MRIIFLFSQTDSIILIKALYEMASWLMENRDTYIVFYIPEVIDISQFNKGKLEIRYLSKFNKANEIPEADLIISSDMDLLEDLRLLNRGELLYLLDQDKKIKENSLNILNIIELGIGIPKRFFLPEGKRGKKVLIGGDELSEKELKKILLAIEKAAPSFYADDILVISSSEKITIDTSLDYSFIPENEIDFSEQFKNSFYLIWIAKNTYPIIPIWAMATGVIVIAVNHSDISFQYPIEIKTLESMELALELIKTYKIGQYRNRLLSISNDISRNMKMDIIGGKWYSYFEDNLKYPKSNEDNINPEIYNCLENNNKDYLLDIIIDNCSSMEYLDNCINNIKRYIKLSHRIIVVGNNIDSSEIVNDLEDKANISIIDNNENASLSASCNKAILLGKGEYILFIKDTINVNDEFIEPLIDVAEKDVAIVKSSLVGADGRAVDGGMDALEASFKGRSWQNKIKGFEFDGQQVLFAFNKAPFLIRRDLLPVIGLFDEAYLSSYEKIDYSLRAREKGYKVLYCSDSVVELGQEDAKIKDIDGSRYIEQNKNSSYNISKKRFFSKWSDLITGGEKRREPDKILVFGLVSWDYKLKRSQELVRNLAKLGYQILYINPVCKIEDSFKQVEDNIYVYTPSGCGTVLYNLQKGREFDIGIVIADLLRKLNFNNCITIINSPYCLAILKYIEYSLLVYDCLGNYSEYENLPFCWNCIKNEEKVLYLSDLVLTSSSALYHEKKKMNENTYMLSNGFNKDKFYLRYQPSEMPEDIPIGDMIVGYCGPISSYFDIKLIKAAAERYKGAKFILIGEIDTDISVLLKLNNVIFTGYKSYNHLAEYLYYFDLAIIPFKINEHEQTDFLIPYNLYEYICAGKRVLTTNFPEVEKFKAIVEIEESSEQFIDKMGQLLSQEDSDENKVNRYNKIKQYDWYNRAQDLKQMIHLAYYDLYLSEDDCDRAGFDQSQDHQDQVNESTISSLNEDEILKTSSLEKFSEINKEIEVEVKEKKSLIKKIINFLNK